MAFATIVKVVNNLLPYRKKKITSKVQLARLALFFTSIDLIMANSAMETTKDFQDASEIQETRNWNAEMEEQAVQPDNANQDEPQRTTLIAPRGDYEPDAPEAIERMMKNGIKFACSIQSWKVERESMRLKKSFPIYFKLDTQVPVAQIVDVLDAKGLIRNISFLFSVG